MLDTFVSVVAGLIIFPACFSFGINPFSGPSLIFITLPNLDEALFCISDISGIYYTLNIKNLYILSPCFSKYDNLYHYILESAKQAIDAAFTYGVTCNGKRKKKKEFITNSTTD